MTTTERVIKKVGSFGWYQLRVFAIISYAVFFTSFVLMVMTFSTAEPPWKCKANSTSCTLNGTFKAGDKDYEHRCQIPRKDWEFAVEGNFDSIVTEWDLVCDTAVYASLTNSLTFLLGIFGGVLASILSDKFGRKTVVFPFTMLTCTCGFLSAFAQTYWVFVFFRALAGIGLGGASNSGYILVMEYIGVRYRGAVGIGYWSSWILSLGLLSLLGYLIQDWRILSISTSAPGMIFFLFWWFTPESLRWLLVRGKTDEAKKTLKTAARVNKKVILDDDMNLLGTDEEKERLGDIRDLFVSRSMAHRTLLSWFCWFVNGLVYYGISLSTPTVGGNMYLNFFLSTVCEAIAMAIAVPILNRFGRKKTIIVCLWLSGVVMITAALLSYYDDGSQGFLAGKIVSAMVLGKFFITISYDGVYLYSSELFPTVVRNTATGTSNASSRVGSTLAPYIVYSQRLHPMTPFAIMSATAFVCGILFTSLPETNKKAMPDTVKQICGNTEGDKVDLQDEDTTFLTEG
ncbi:organic cation transporter-like protein isoform X1 [Actinia tenebrosa]|uniref:Organic cation transporter-like protein isoform X1 n=1 Tax=Actinia tenebrosa TaxID=6105 RepID=A0A6P8IEK2_ACTTE|nr:organic cation transporter-like protein isoform X1 [Actinia tenebrosa]XP_031565338.1 organic cation transporter-like protein isoform X1 [Actinia tenebrosa]